MKMKSGNRAPVMRGSLHSSFPRWCAAAMLWATVAPPLHAGAASGKPARDLTFFVVSDTHYGSSPQGDETVLLLVDKMNAIPGTEYPAVIGGKVGTPRGVLHIGDITNNGKKEQWAMFVKDYGLTGKDGRLKWPVYECYGNHDGGPKTPVRDGIRERNPKRVGLTSISENGIHYCWNWDGILFINLGIAPGTTARPYDPEYSMEYLEETLKQHAKPGQPLVLLHHFGFDQSHSLNWWPLERRTRYHELIADHNVIDILHGHAHQPFIYQWKGIDVFHPPHFNQKDPKLGGLVSHGFFVIHVFGDELTVAERKLDDTWGMTFHKKIDPLAAKNNPVTTKPGTPEP